VIQKYIERHQSQAPKTEEKKENDQETKEEVKVEKTHAKTVAYNIDSMYEKNIFALTHKT
jgi:hypothetical protein